jgi:hypothetical protein
MVTINNPEAGRECGSSLARFKALNSNPSTTKKKKAQRRRQEGGRKEGWMNRKEGRKDKKDRQRKRKEGKEGGREEGQEGQEGRKEVNSGYVLVTMWRNWSPQVLLVTQQLLTSLVIPQNVNTELP